MRTLGRRIIHLTPPQGFAAETTAASILYVAGLAFGAPISTTHTITSSIMGVGATKRLSAVRWGVAGNIVGAWILTFPGAGLVAVVTWYVTVDLPLTPTPPPSNRKSSPSGPREASRERDGLLFRMLRGAAGQPKRPEM